jgi:hypothetical protein
MAAVRSGAERLLLSGLTAAVDELVGVRFIGCFPTATACASFKSS